MRVFKSKKTKSDINVDEVVETEIEYVCPIKGRVKQVVKVKKMKALKPADKAATANISSLIEDLDGKDDGLSMYEDVEE